MPSEFSFRVEIDLVIKVEQLLPTHFLTFRVAVAKN